MPRLYAITDRRIAGCSHLDQVRSLASAGVRLIQLREKHSSSREFFDEARSCVEFAHGIGVRIVIDDRADIALTAAADGVHLGQEDIPPELARRLLGDDKLIGVSTHNLNQALEADALPVDYLAVGPIFSTKTKEKAAPEVGLAALRQICAVVRKPVVAVGGINLENVLEVFRAGARSAAVISDLLNGPDIPARARAFLARLDEI